MFSRSRSPSSLSAAAGEFRAGAAELQPVVAFENLHVLMTEVQARLAAVVDHAGDVALVRLVVFISEQTNFLGRVNT